MSHSMQQSFSQYVDAQDSSASLSRHDRVAGIVSLLEGGTTKTTKGTKVLDFAKKCPVRWSKQATLNNINLPLYAWGSVAELEASLSGRAEAMEEGVLLGKLRHLQSILEGEKKDLCTSYNKCQTEGKCEYEVTHPGKVCLRKHECSYCR